MTSVRGKILVVAAASLLAAIATFTAVMLMAMHAASREEETEQLSKAVMAYRETLGVRQRASEAILQTIAWRPDVRAAMAERDVRQLQELLEPTFRELEQRFDIVQLSVMMHDGTVLLRLHAPDDGGDSYGGRRPIVVEAADKRTTVSAVDLDGGKLRTRTVTPVMQGTVLLGLLEVGHDCDEALLREMKLLQGIDSRVWLTYEEAGASGLLPSADLPKSPLPELFLHASTYGNRRLMPTERYGRLLKSGAAQTEFLEEGDEHYAAIAVPLVGHSSRMLGILEISRSRAPAIASFRNSLLYTLMVATAVALAGIAVLAATLNIVILRPLKSLTQAARRQYDGDLSARATKTSSDEVGLLADTFNSLSNRLTQTLREQEQSIHELKAAQRAEEEASAAKDQFLASLSHELRTPLTPVLLAAESFERSALIPPEIQEDVHVIRRNVELEARLIDDLLDLTRITQDKLELHLHVCEVHSLIAAAISVCSSEAKAKELRVETSFGAGSQWVNADPARLQQVFWNLVKNAVKFSPQKGNVTITTQNETVDGKEHLLVNVADTGIGMSQEVQKKLFTVFEQGSRWITRTFGGLGLGLAISKKIVERHGGRIAGWSEGQGRGSTFTVWLPTVPQPEVSVEPPARKPVEAPPLKILLVEDHSPTARAIKRLLEESGHTVTCANSVSAAMAAATQDGFSLVISDLGLPDGDGAEMMRDLRARHGLGGIAVSGFGMQDDITRSAEAGFLAHLTKPITAEQLRYAISEAWEKLSGWTAADL